MKDDFKKYYSDVCQNILLKIKDKQYQEALVILDDELDQPYIPSGEMYQKLLQIRLDLLIQIKENDYFDEVQNFTKLDLWNKIYNKEENNIDLAFINIFKSKFNDIDEVDKSIIQQALKDKKLTNQAKAILISNFIEINHEFDYFNNFTKECSKVNFNKFLDLPIQKEIEIIKNEFQQIFMQDPVKMEIAYGLLQVLAITYIPNEIKFSQKEIVDSIILITNSLFTQDEIKETKLIKLLKTFVQ